MLSRSFGIRGMELVGLEYSWKRDLFSSSRRESPRLISGLVGYGGKGLAAVPPRAMA